MLHQIGELPPMLQAIVALDAWNELAVLQHAPWLGRLLAASIPRQAGLTTAAHVATVNLGLKSIPSIAADIVIARQGCSRSPTA